MKPLPLRTHGRPAGYVVERNIRTHGERLARRRDQIADMWSGRHDGRRWTAQEIAVEIGIETAMVYRHIKALREDGDARAKPRPFPDSVTARSPLRMVETSE